MRNRLFSLLLALSLLPCAALDESLTLDEMNAAEDATPLSAAEAAQPVESAARADFIDRILALAETLYAKANGQPQRAQYSGDIYVCKNYTVHLFRETCGDFRMAEYPDVPLVIPNNQKKADCAPYVYGVEWQDVPASEGNPFYAAASFRYDDTLSKAENREKRPRVSKTGSARRLFPDGRGLLLRRGRAQHALHRRLRPGDGQRPLGGFQHEGQKRKRRSLCLRAV